jgi:hypothetical protein
MTAFLAWLAHIGTLTPPPSLDWVGSWWFIALALVASVVDFFGDKIPVLDHALHSFHVALAPAAGAIAAMTGYHGDPLTTVIVGVLGGGQALALHSAKSGLRAASTVTTMGTANVLISIAEDILATVFIFTALVAPWLTAAALLVATVWLFRKLKKAARRRTRSAAA